MEVERQGKTIPRRLMIERGITCSAFHTLDASWGSVSQKYNEHRIRIWDKSMFHRIFPYDTSVCNRNLDKS